MNDLRDPTFPSAANVDRDDDLLTLP